MAVHPIRSEAAGEATYVAPRRDWDWLRIEQRKLYVQSVDYVFRRLWGLAIDLRNATNRRAARSASTSSPIGPLTISALAANKAPSGVARPAVVERSCKAAAVLDDIPPVQGCAKSKLLTPVRSSMTPSLYKVLEEQIAN